MASCVVGSVLSAMIMGSRPVSGGASYFYSKMSASFSLLLQAIWYLSSIWYLDVIWTADGGSIGFSNVPCSNVPWGWALEGPGDALAGGGRDGHDCLFS